MAIKKVQLATIAKILKLKQEDLEAAISDANEVDLTLDEKLQSFTEQEIGTRDTNKYNEGKSAGEEMLVKKVREKSGVEIQGKDPDKIIEAITAKAVKDAGIPSNDQIAEKEKTITQLRSKLQEKDGEISTLKTAASQATKDSRLLGMLPVNRDDRFTNEQYLTLIKSEYDIVEVDGKQAVKNLRTGEIVKNTTDFSTLAPEEVIKNHFTTAKWIKEAAPATPTGRGGGNSVTGDKPRFNKMSEIRKYAEDNNINIAGEKFQRLYSDAKAENKDLIID